MLSRKRKIFMVLMLLNYISNKNKAVLNHDKSTRNKLNLHSFYGLIEVKHSIKGRIRFKVDILKGNKKISEVLIKELKKIELIKECQVNLVTASLLVEYDACKIDGETIQGVIMKLLNLDKSIENGRGCNLRLMLKENIKAIDSGVYDFTRGYLDTKGVFIVVFLLGAIYRYRKMNKDIFEVLNLLWWSSRLI